ncbi:MAG TPA: hypothetical protein VIR63_07425 [Pontiella sp.]
MASNKSFESTLHDIVYSIDTGVGLKLLRIGLYILILLIVVMIYTATQFRGLKTEESMDLVQLGRNISIKDGLATKTVRPLTMWKMQQRTPDKDPLIFSHPDLFHPPAYPAVLAAGFKLFEAAGIDPFKVSQSGRGMSMPAEQWVIIPVNHLFAILTGWMVFLLGKRLFSREIGFLGMTIYYLSNLVWKDSISGLNITMAGFFVMAAFYAMVVSMLNKRDNKSRTACLFPFFISIMLAAIAFLTRYITLAAIPGLCLFAFLMSGRFRGGLRYVVAFLVLFSLLISPWLIRNYKVCGNPAAMVGYTALADSTHFPENSLNREYQPELSFRSITTTLKQKWIMNYAGKHASVAPSMGGGVLMALFLTTFFYHFIRPQVNYLRWGVGLSFILMLVLAGFFSESSVNMIHVFWPFVILYALAFFYILIDRLDLGVRLYSMGLKLLIVILAALPLGMTLMPPHTTNHPYPPYHAPIIARVATMLNEREVMCTDMPWATAWYGDRVSILLPKNLDQFYEINDYQQYISGLYFTGLTTDRPFAKDLLAGAEQEWLPIFSGRLPPDFPLKEAININQQRKDQVFFSDRNRWAESAVAQ